MKLPYEIAIGLGVLLLALMAAVFLGFTLIALVRGRASKCPKCESKRIRPAWPLIVDKLLPLFVLAQRCESCGKRFYAGHSVDYSKSTPRRKTQTPNAGAPTG